MANAIEFRRSRRRQMRGAALSSRWLVSLLLAGCLSGLYPTPVCAQARPSYVAIEYARLDNPGATIVIRGMNSANEVAGGFQTDRRKASSALIFSANNIADDVSGAQGAGSSVAYAINDQGEVSGAYNTSTAQRPFRSVRKTGFQELSLPAGSNGGAAFAMNEKGEATGYVSGTSGIRPVWWSRRGDVELLQTAGNGTVTQAFDINDRGDIVGVSGREPRLAVMWPRKGGLVRMGTLPGFTHSEAVSINENGAVAGTATGVSESPNRSRAIWWQPDGLTIYDLGTLAGGTDSRARDVNARGEIVGTSNSAAGDRAFVWTATTGMRDLNTLVNVPGLIMTDALSINRRGDIVVMGYDGHTHAHGDPHEHVDHHAARRIFVLRAVQ
ncbi:MAG: hypothetical protein JWP47_1849 [Polaromonas sp.]|nr:hypothetical protein [Polaromonas sp.]